MIIPASNCFQRCNSFRTFLIRICLKNYRRREYSSWSIIETLLYSQRTRNRTVYSNNNTYPQQSTRISSSSNNNNGSEIQLPEPTWSINSLELNKNHKPMEYNELKVLAKRAIIDLHYLSNTTNKMSIETLRQDLGNMMHMIQNITITSNNKQQQNDDNSMTCQDIYDKPRGVTTAPIRTTIPITQSKKNIDNNVIQVATNDSSINNNFHHVTNASTSTEEDNKKLWDQYIKPTKMKSVGGHYYFVIPTKIEKKK